MQRTTIMLPPPLKLQAQQLARERGISLGDLVRQALSTMLNRIRETGEQMDPLFADQALWEGDAPCDLSQNLDEYLYGEGP
jgi:hypothetical protein